MKLFQYYNEEKEACVGAVVNGDHIALTEDIKMSKMLKKDDAYIQKLIAGGKTTVLDAEQIEFAPVISKPEKILCIGLNYDDHISETGMGDQTKPGFPPIFPKYRNALVGHNQPIHLPKNAHQFDYEVELVIVIGRKCKEVTVEQASDFIAGYTIGNDFSARDLQLKTSQWTLGKTCDDFAPVGPYFVSKNEINPDNLAISCKVNGEDVQKSNTSNMIYKCTEIVSYLSQYITLEKGDLIFTGTPSGVILGKNASEQNWLKAGDVITSEIEEIGTLKNVLV